MPLPFILIAAAKIALVTFAASAIVNLVKITISYISNWFSKKFRNKAVAFDGNKIPGIKNNPQTKGNTIVLSELDSNNDLVEDSIEIVTAEEIESRLNSKLKDNDGVIYIER